MARFFDKGDNFMIIYHQGTLENSGGDIITKSAHDLPLVVQHW